MAINQEVDIILHIMFSLFTVKALKFYTHFVFLKFKYRQNEFHQSKQ